MSGQTSTEDQVQQTETETSETLDGTGYVVLSKDGSGFWTAWRDLVNARSAESAIRQFLADQENPAGTYVAVPQRSWKPVTVSAVQTTVLKLEDAT